MTDPLARYLDPLPLIAVLRGINPDKMAAYWEAGAAGFGTGSSVYKPGATVPDVAAAAAAFAAAVRRLPARPSINRTPPTRSEAS